MSLHDDAVLVLKSYEDQAELRQVYLDHLAAHPDGMWKACGAGHITASGLVIDPERGRVLLTLHKKLRMWLQMGGHCERGDTDLAATARREAVEESGIDGLVLEPGPLDLDIHPLDCPKGHPNRHLDVRWLAIAPPGAIERPSDESPHLRWFPLERPPDDADDSTLRLVRVARSSAT